MTPRSATETDTDAPRRSRLIVFIQWARGTRAGGGAGGATLGVTIGLGLGMDGLAVALASRCSAGVEHAPAHATTTMDTPVTRRFTTTIPARTRIGRSCPKAGDPGGHADVEYGT